MKIEIISWIIMMFFSEIPLYFFCIVFRLAIAENKKNKNYVKY